MGSMKTRVLFISLIMAVLAGSCVFPFTTASYKWKIKWEKADLEKKKEYLEQKLPDYSKGKLPNILVIVVDVMSATSFDSVELASNPEIVISSPSAVYVLVKKLVT